MEDVMSIVPLGSGQEVGRSCHLLEFRGITILLDCGIHPGYEGLNGLPFFDKIENAEKVDVLLITHFHLDHAASLPYFTERTSFRGRIFMTHPTKAVIRLLLGDYLRLLSMKNRKRTADDGADAGGADAGPDVLYTEAELQSCVDKIELIDYHQTVSLGRGLKFHALNAGHVLGAAMFLIDIGGRSVLYTGDYSLEDDRHLMAAEIPAQKPDVLIVESTYGVQVHTSRRERESRFTSTIERIVTRGGKCLIPVFALGRAQELLLILDEFWSENAALQSVPIYYASKLASRALRVYQTYANMMNMRIRAYLDIGNPFDFNFIRNLKSIDINAFTGGSDGSGGASATHAGPCVVFASPGMLQSGVSRQLFDKWCTDPKNGVVIAGYAVENTMAKDIMLQPKEVTTLDGRRQPLQCLVDYVSFSAHVDFLQNRTFISKVDPKHIILVHGQKEEMGRLKSALMIQHRQLPENKRPTITMPPNLQEVKLKFTRRRSAKVMGELADGPEPKEGQEVQGILVTQNFNSKIVSPQDLSTYTPLRVGSVSSTLHVPFVGTLDTLRLFLQEMFVGVTEQAATESESSSSRDKDDVPDGGAPITIFGLHDNKIQVILGKTKGVATVRWDASPVGDVLADAVVSLLMHAQGSTASIRLASKPCQHRKQFQQEEEEANPNQDASADVPNKEEEEAPMVPQEKGASSSDVKMKDANDDDDKAVQAKKRARRCAPPMQSGTVAESRLRLFHDTLLEQFEAVEAVYEAHGATFEISTDSGLESGSLAAGERLVCTATVQFEDARAENASIHVECTDTKLATNVMECLKSVAASAAPLKTLS